MLGISNNPILFQEKIAKLKLKEMTIMIASRYLMIIQSEEKVFHIPLS